MSRPSPERKRSPHMRGVTGPVIDYNGTGAWSLAGIQARYLRYARDLGVEPSNELVPRISAEGAKTWIYPIMDQVIALIDHGDAAAIEIGVEMIEEDDFFYFGSLIKSNTARALRRTLLSESQQLRLRQRIVGMMLAGNVPHEFREYKRLLRKVGVAELWPKLDAEVDRENRYVMRYYDYLKEDEKNRT